MKITDKESIHLILWPTFIFTSMVEIDQPYNEEATFILYWMPKLCQLKFSTGKLPQSLREHDNNISCLKI